MFRKLFSATLLAMALVATASAQYLSEIKYAATNQTSLLSATAIVSAGIGKRERQPPGVQRPHRARHGYVYRLRGAALGR